MPRLAKLRETTLATSSSQPGRILGRPSSTVTFTPRSASIEANSQPMAPPPITAADFGRVGMASTSSEVRTYLPSTSNPGIVLGTDPAARITLAASSVTESPGVPSPAEAASTTTRPSPRYRPVPAMVVMPRPLMVPWSPFH